MLRLLLGDFLDKHRISVEKLADTISENLIADEKAVSERYLRYLKSNREPLTASNQNRKPSLLMLGLIIRALRVLTQKSVTISDILEYSDNTTLPLPKNQLFEHKDSDSQHSYTLIRKNKRNDFDLDDLWELVVQTLESKNHFKLSQVVKEASNSQSNSKASKKTPYFSSASDNYDAACFINHRCLLHL